MKLLKPELNERLVDSINKLYKSFLIVDTHDHSESPVNQKGINIDSDLSFNKKAVKSTGIVFNNISESPREGSIYFKDNELFIHPFGGEPFQLTKDGTFNEDLVGVVRGDYDTSDALFLYSSNEETYYILDDVNPSTIFSDIEQESIIIHSSDARGASGVKILASEDTNISYSLIMPETSETHSTTLIWKPDGSSEWTPSVQQTSNKFIVNTAGVHTYANIELSLLGTSDPYKIIQYTADGTIDPDVTNSFVKFPCGSTSERPINPPDGTFRINTTINLPEYYIDGEWKSIAMSDAQGLVLNDFTDCTVLDAEDGSILMRGTESWEAYSRPTLDWDSTSGDSQIVDKPDDITDLSQHSIMDLSNVEGEKEEGYILKWNEEEGLTTGFDLGAGAVFGNITGTITSTFNSGDVPPEYIGLSYEWVEGDLNVRGEGQNDLMRHLAGYEFINEVDESNYEPEGYVESKLRIVDSQEDEKLGNDRPFNKTIYAGKYLKSTDNIRGWVRSKAV